MISKPLRTISVFIDDRLNDRELQDLWDLIIRSCYRGFIGDFTNMTSWQLDLYSTLVDSLGPISYVNGMCIIGGNTVFRILTGNGIPENGIFRLPENYTLE